MKGKVGMPRGLVAGPAEGEDPLQRLRLVAVSELARARRESRTLYVLRRGSRRGDAWLNWLWPGNGGMETGRGQNKAQKREQRNKHSLGHHRRFNHNRRCLPFGSIGRHMRCCEPAETAQQSVGAAQSKAERKKDVSSRTRGQTCSGGFDQEVGSALAL